MNDITLFNDQNNNMDFLDPTKNYMEELVGEGRKFKSPEELAYGKMEADRYIKTLEKQKDELRTDYLKLREEATTQAKLQDLLDKMEARQNSQNTQNTSVLDEIKPYDPNEMKSLVSNEIRNYEVQKKAQNNLNTVNSKLKEQFGANSQRVLQERMDILGLEPQDIDNLAKKSPTAFFNTLGLNDVKNDSFNSPVLSSMRSDPFASKSEKRNYAYYQKMKQTNPKAYLDPKIAVQMDKDSQAMGMTFFD